MTNAPVRSGRPARVVRALLISVLACIAFAPGVRAENAATATTTTTTSSTSSTTVPVSVGIYYGRLYLVPVDGSSVITQSLDSTKRRRTFYLDRHTEYFVNGKPASWNDIFVGDKVAVRYFAEGRISAADAVYVVFGDFEAGKYEKQKATRPKKAAGKKKKKH